MPRSRRIPRALLGLVAAALATHPARADTVVLRNGIVYRGTVDRDNALLWIYDGLKRVVVRDSKVARIDPDAALRNLENFKIEQPLVVHGGVMPKEVLSARPGPWDDRGRRPFEYVGSRLGKTLHMEQAIYELGPYLVKLRGVDGFWQSQLATKQVPREVVLSILDKIDRRIESERFRAARFLIQAEWYREAAIELDRLLRDFPEDATIKERVDEVRTTLAQLEAIQTRAAADRARAAQQPAEVARLLAASPSRDISSELLDRVGEQQRALSAQAEVDKALASDLRDLSEQLPADARKSWKSPLLEVLKALQDAPDAVRDRFVGWQTAKAAGGKTPEAEFALAVSGFVVGGDVAADDLDLARTLWDLRDEVRAYLAGHDAEVRAEHLAKIEGVSLPPDPATPAPVKKLDTLTRLAQRMAPPLAPDDPKASVGDGPRVHRVEDDDNPVPTEYSVLLPPEYHPLRNYPAVVALHDGRGTPGAFSWWGAEAARRGYVVIAPDYTPPGPTAEYRYTGSEHAAIELALRDARRRYAIDSDRVFLGGQLVGANAAWDFGLAHPDLFAGLVVISGMPFKYVNRYLPHTELLPMFVVAGDLAPAANEVVFGQILKPMINKAWDVTYHEYIRRGLEDFPEETPAAFDWMDRRKRNPYPKGFDVVTARPTDNRFFGVVAREFAAGRTTPPEVVDGFAKNLNPATIRVRSSQLSNLLSLDTGGIKSLDVWVSPRLTDFKRKAEVRINKRPFFKGIPRPEAEHFLEDLRLRGDRTQVYWLKLSAG